MTIASLLETLFTLWGYLLWCVVRVTVKFCVSFCIYNIKMQNLVCGGVFAGTLIIVVLDKGFWAVCDLIGVWSVLPGREDRKQQCEPI